MKKLEEFFLVLGLDIGGKYDHFLQALKFPIYLYFCRLDRVILSRLQRLRKMWKNRK